MIPAVTQITFLLIFSANPYTENFSTNTHTTDMPLLPIRFHSLPLCPAQLTRTSIDLTRPSSRGPAVERNGREWSEFTGISDMYPHVAKTQAIVSTNHTSALLSESARGPLFDIGTRNMLVEYHNLDGIITSLCLNGSAQMRTYLTLGQLLPQEVVTELIREDALKGVESVYGSFVLDEESCCPASHPWARLGEGANRLVKDQEAIWCLQECLNHPCLYDIQKAQCLTGSFFLRSFKGSSQKLSDAQIWELFDEGIGIPSTVVGQPSHCFDSKGIEYRLPSPENNATVVTCDLRLLRFCDRADQHMFDRIKQRFLSQHGILATRKREGLDRDYSMEGQQAITVAHS